MVAYFRRAFEGPAAFWDAEREQRIVTEPREVGSLELPTGRLAIHDPGYEFAPDPLDREVPPGRHRVDLALRSWIGDDGTFYPPHLIAAVRVTLRPGRPERFVAVLSALRGRDLDIGVDSGLVSVFDRALLPTLAGAAILDAMPETSTGTAAGAIEASIWPASAGSVFVCTAGMGDGGYRAWWGEDAEGETVELIVDFGLLEHSLWRTVERPAAALLGSAARIRLAFAGTGLELEPVPLESIGAPLHPVPPGSLGGPIRHTAAEAEAKVALRRPPGPLWEFSLRDGDGSWMGGPGLIQMMPGPWFEVFDRALIERADVVRIRIHEGNVPDEPLEA
jgi:hypothetical protein